MALTIGDTAPDFEADTTEDIVEAARRRQQSAAERAQAAVDRAAAATRRAEAALRRTRGAPPQ